jgi:chromosome segregation ATPase
VLRTEVSRVVMVIHDAEARGAALDEERQAVQMKIAALHRTAAGIGSEQAALTRSIAAVQVSMAEAQSDLVERGNQKKNADKTLSSLDAELANSKSTMGEYLRDYDQLLQTLQDMTVSLSRQKAQNGRAQDELDEQERLLAARRKDVDSLRRENAKLTELKELARLKLAEIEAERRELEERRAVVEHKAGHTRDVLIRAAQREIESQSRQRAALRTELAIVKKKYLSSDHVVSALADMLQVNANASRNLSFEKYNLQQAVAALQLKADQIVSEKEALDREAEGVNQKYYTELEELKLQELQVKELQQKIAEDTGRLKQKQNLYEVVRSDRNLYSKQLVDLQNDIATLRTTFRQMNHTIEQQKEDISARDSLIVKEHFLHHSVEKERELLKNQLIKSRKQVLSSKDIVDNQQTEIVKLSRIITEADQERSRQKNELQSVLAERNLLTSQVVRRHSELEAVYSKIKVQRNSLRMGERQYDQLMGDIFKWQKEVVHFVRARHEVMDRMVDFESLKRQEVQLQRELTGLKMKSRALSDELDLPMNIHRWRVLESSDPDRYELIRHIQDLQKQLIGKSDLVVAKERQIKEQEKVYVELRSAISRQPGPEVEEQILVYQQTLKDKVRQQRAMEDELDMYRQQVQVFGHEISAIDTEMDKLKKKWFKSVKMRANAAAQ